MFARNEKAEKFFSVLPSVKNTKPFSNSLIKEIAANLEKTSEAKNFKDVFNSYWFSFDILPILEVDASPFFSYQIFVLNKGKASYPCYINFSLFENYKYLICKPSQLQG